MNFGDESSNLKAACNKVRRIDNLRNEIDDYARKVINLDSNLDIRYRAWENAENVDVMEQMKELTEGEKTAISQLNIFLTVLSWKYNEQEYENIAQLLQTDENGTFEFEKLLQKETLTEDEIEALAHLYEEAYEQIGRTEDCQLSVNIVQCYTEKLFYFEEDTKGINEYYVSAKDSLLQSILDKIDTGNEATIYSLENLKGTKLEVKKSWFESSWKEFGSSVTELKDFKDSTDMISVMLVKTDLGIQTVLYAYPAAGKREEHADEGYKVNYEKELYDLPLLDRCARSGYIMTKEEEKQVEKEVKAYFSIKENKNARDIALNFGPDNVSQSTKVDFTPEEYEKFQQMYLLYRKTSDKDAFYSNFLLTKPFTYGGIVDRLMGYPENGSHEREYLEMAAEQNSGSYMLGSIAGEVALEGLKRTGINLGANGAFEAVFKVGKGVLGGIGEEGINSYDEFSKAVSDIGKRTDLTDLQKIENLQKVFENSNYKTDINVPSDIQYVKGFDARGNVIYDWPPKLGFEENTIKPISRTDGLPDTWDRYGYMGGSNFADVPPTGKYTYSERAIPYVENPAAYHKGTFNNATYFDKIDATYGLKGTAASWGDMSGGAGQIVTPLNGTILMRLGIIR